MIADRDRRPLFATFHEPPEKRRAKAAGGVEEKLTEAAVMFAMACYVLDNATAATTVSIHPDGEHAKRFDISGWLRRAGFVKIESLGSTSYGGTYRRGSETVVVDPVSETSAPLTVEQS